MKSASDKRVGIRETIQHTDENEVTNYSEEENQDEQMDIDLNMEEEDQEATETPLKE